MNKHPARWLSLFLLVAFVLSSCAQPTPTEAPAPAAQQSGITMLDLENVKLEATATDPPKLTPTEEPTEAPTATDEPTPTEAKAEEAQEEIQEDAEPEEGDFQSWASLFLAKPKLR